MNFPTTEMIDSSVLSSMSQGWREYDRGFDERCPQSQVERTRRQFCYQQARQRLHTWLNKQTEACLKVKMPANRSTTTRLCRASADAVFSYIVRYRETE